MIARNDPDIPDTLTRRALLFTLKNYALFGSPGYHNFCWAWTRRKFLGWLREGWLHVLKEDGDPILFVETTDEWAVAHGCYWLKCRTLVGDIVLYALLPWPLAEEAGRLLGVELVDPRA